MEELLRKRERIQAKLTCIAVFVEKINNQTTSADLAIWLELIADVWAEFDRIQTQIECVCEDEQLSLQQEVQTAFEENFCKQKAKLMQAQNQLNLTINLTSEEPTQGINNQNAKAHIKLPTIELPTFTGSYQHWTSFSDLFTSVIDKNQALTPVQKLHYLKSAIRGEAAKVLSAITVTDANYAEAWKLLSERFENKRQIIQTHLKLLYSQQKLTNESSKDIRRLLDTTNENVRALHTLGQPTEQWDCLLVYLITERVDSATRQHWELSLTDTEMPTFSKLKEFLERRCRALEASSQEKPTLSRALNANAPKKIQPSMTYHTMTVSCAKCSGQHQLYACDQFLALPIKDRINYLKTSSLCFNCLRRGHSAKTCKATTCKRCKKFHNTLVHLESEKDSVPIVSSHSTANAINLTTQVVLGTALVQTHDRLGQPHIIRALLDNGSQTTFITEACVQRLGLKKYKGNHVITGIGNSGMNSTKGTVNLEFQSNFDTKKHRIAAIILHRITGHLPTSKINPAILSPTIRKHKMQLADPEYYTPKPIDILLGADIYYELIKSGRVQEDISSATLYNTTLGWIIAGSIKSEENLNKVLVHVSLDELSHQLKNFWELEEITTKKSLTKEERECEEHFTQTHTRNHEGRLVVKLPFRQESECLGDSKPMALKRFLQVENRMKASVTIQREYIKFMREYLRLDHMKKLSSNQHNTRGYYLPYHYVIRDQATTTKLRVVFDGSAQPLGGLSLNQALMVGPTIQDDITDIILRFRIHNIVYLADIQMMYRQILVDQEHQKYQRILWREHSNDKIEEDQLLTVTYGTSAAPFLAIRSLWQLAEIGQETHPKAAKVIKRDFYIDDVISGTDTIQSALQTQEELINLLETGGFELHKWTSNTNELLSHLEDQKKN